MGLEPVAFKSRWVRAADMPAVECAWKAPDCSGPARAGHPLYRLTCHRNLPRHCPRLITKAKMRGLEGSSCARDLDIKRREEPAGLVSDYEEFKHQNDGRAGN